jgi:uncharacterized protein (DUF2062 family)
MWHRFRNWISPVRAWRVVRHDPAERPRFAAGLALGVFIANLPLYGAQTLLSFYAARRLKLNPVAVVAGSHLSTPPLGPVLVAAAIALGHLMLHGAVRPLASFHASPGGYIALARSVLLEWVAGSLVLGAALGAATFMITSWLLGRLPAGHGVPRTPAVAEDRPAGPAPIPDRAGAKSAA